MDVDVFDRNPYGTNCWLLSAEGGDEAVVVDPGFEPAAVHALLDAADKRPVAVLLTHAHFDHAGAAGTFAGALPVYVHPDDLPAFADYSVWGGGSAAALDAVADLRTFVDGDVLRLAGLRLDVLHTPGHTPGSTTWTWRSCEGDRCLNIVYADSLTSVSHDAFRFTGDATHASVVESFQRSIAVVAKLPCDILLSVHPDMSHMDDKLARRAAGNADAFVDPEGCRSYAADAERNLQKRIAAEKH